MPGISFHAMHQLLRHHELIGRIRIGMVFAPLADRVRDVRDLAAHDERPAGILDIFQVLLTHHPGISDHDHISDPVSLHEPPDQRDHRLGLGAVAFERFDHQRGASGIGQQPDSNLWLQAAFLRKSWLTEPVTGIGFEP